MFPYGIMCMQGEKKFHFVVRNQKPLNLACRASFDEETLAQQVGPLAPGYWTALLWCPGHGAYAFSCTLCP